MNFKDLPIKRKIILVMMLTSVSALLLAGAIFFAFQIKNYKTELLQEMESIAAIIGANSQAAIEFDDRPAAEKILAALKQDKRIHRATLFDANGQVFAAVENLSLEDPQAADNGALPAHNFLLKHTIRLSDKVVGSVLLEVDPMGGLYKRLIEFGVVALLTLVFAGFAAYILSRRLQRVISLPIINLAETARKVSVDNDYTLRAKKESNDEIGLLIDRFNEMLEQIKKEDSERRKAEDKLRDLNEELEKRVAERTEELKQSLERLRRSERLASIGTLAAGMAHEIRNPINSISLASQHALRYQKELNPMHKKTLDSIASEAQRCGTIVKNILLFAKSEKTAKAPENINEIIYKAVSLAKTYSKSNNVQIQTELDNNPAKVPVNPTEIEQVIVNILNNAIEAASGNVRILVKSINYPDRYELAISDDGPGIPQEILGQIFDPFFSTKRKQGNTGLGLSLCHGIISEHQGYLNVQSTVGQGTIFSIELPKELR